MCLLLWTTALLMADEFVIRPADYLYLEKYGFQTAEGNWLVFFSAHGNSSETIYCHKISVTGVLSRLTPYPWPSKKKTKGS